MNEAKKRIYVSLGVSRDLKLGDSAPVYLDNDRDNPVGVAEIVETEDGGSECLITLDFSNPRTQEVLSGISPEENISVGGTITPSIRGDKT